MRIGSSTIEKVSRSTDGADGLRFVRDVLMRVAKDPHPESIVIAFDLDCTIFDPRPRTLRVLRAYETATNRDFGFSHLSLDDMKTDGLETALALGIDPNEAQLIQGYWRERFWQSSAFLHDGVFESVRALAWLAHRLGATVMYVTGRIDQEGSIRQLAAANLPNADRAHVRTKAKGESTMVFKPKCLSELATNGRRLGWYVTESHHELSVLMKTSPGHPMMRVSYPLDKAPLGQAVDLPCLDDRWTETSVAISRTNPPTWETIRAALFRAGLEVDDLVSEARTQKTRGR